MNRYLLATAIGYVPILIWGEVRDISLGRFMASAAIWTLICFAFDVRAILRKAKLRRNQ